MSQGSIRKRGDRYYVRTRVRVIDPDTGKAKWKDVEKAAGRKRRDALAMLKELQHQVDEGRYVPNATTVLELGQRWLREHAQRNLKPSTAANYKGTFYTHVAPVLGSYRVDEQAIPEQVRRLLERKHDEALAPETIAKIHRHLHAMFAFAVEERILATNPVEALGRRRKGKVKHKTRGTALTLVEVRRFLEACSPRWRLFFRVALSTGLRRGEMIGLRWGDVSLSERVLQVRRWNRVTQRGFRGGVQCGEQDSVASPCGWACSSLRSRADRDGGENRVCKTSKRSARRGVVMRAGGSGRRERGS